MKIPPAPLFIVAFLIFVYPWCLYTLWLLRYMRYRLGRSSLRPPGFLVAKRTIEKTPDPEGQRLSAQAFRWLKICFVTWSVGFVLLVLVVMGMDRAGWLARG